MSKGDDDIDADVGTAAAQQGVPGTIRAACAVLGLEALGLTGLAAFLVVDTLAGNANSLARALLGAVLALVGAAALAVGARGLLRLSPAARSPMVVLQLVSIPVGYTIAFQAGRVGYGGPILIAAFATLYLLFAPPSRAALEREPRG